MIEAMKISTDTGPLQRCLADVVDLLGDGSDVPPHILRQIEIWSAGAEDAVEVTPVRRGDVYFEVGPSAALLSIRSELRRLKPHMPTRE